MKQIYFTPNGKNRTSEVVETLLQAENGTEIIFEKGTYDFYMTGTHRGYFSIGCNKLQNTSNYTTSIFTRDEHF